MAKSFIAAVLLAAALVAAVVVPTALTRGTFGFDAWPEAPTAKARDEAVVIAEPRSNRGIPHAEQRPREQRAADRQAAPSIGTPSLPEAVAGAEQPADDSTPRPDRDQGETRETRDPELEQAPAPEVPSAPAEELAQGEEFAPQDAPEIEARPTAVPEPAPEPVAPSDDDKPGTPAPVWEVVRDGWKRDGRDQREDRGNRPDWAGRGNRPDSAGR